MVLATLEHSLTTKFWVIENAECLKMDRYLPSEQPASFCAHKTKRANQSFFLFSCVPGQFIPFYFNFVELIARKSLTLHCLYHVGNGAGYMSHNKMMANAHRI